MTLLDYPYNDVGHLVNNLCHPCWIRKDPTLNVGQVSNLMLMDGDIMWCNRSLGAHEPPVQVLDL